MLRNGVMPMPPAIKTKGARGKGLGARVNSPAGPLAKTCLPAGRESNAFLKLLPLSAKRETRRVSGSVGEEAMVKKRRVPRLSDLG